MSFKTKRILITSIKMTLACLGGTLIASAFKLDNYLTCGVIAVLSIHYSKRDSYVSAAKRFISGIIGIFFSTLMFFALGYNLLAYIFFVLIFSSLSWALRVPEGIVPSIVLVTHLYSEGKLSWPLILNEIYIVIIAILVALILNVIDTLIKDSRNDLTNRIDTIIAKMISLIESKVRDTSLNITDECLILERQLENLYSEILSSDRDNLINNNHYNLNYAVMRKNQFKSLQHIKKMLDDIKMYHANSSLIASYFSMLALKIGDANMAIPMRDELADLKDFFKKSELPKTRSEFETRATLFQILNEIDNFLLEKVEFHNLHVSKK